MLKSNQDKVHEWLRGIIWNSANPSGRCARISLKQIVNNTPTQASLRDWAIPEMKEGEISGEFGDVNELAQEIVQLAQDDAEVSSMPQQYCCVAFFGKDTQWSARSPRMTFRSEQAEMMTADGSGAFGGGFDSEPATMQGHHAQMMRHNEMLFRGAVGSMGQIMEAQQRHIDRLMRNQEHNEEMRLKIMLEYEQLLSQRHERQLEIQREERKQAIQADMIEQVKILGPTIVNRISGKKLLPEKTDPDLEIVYRIFGTLKPEQTREIFSVFNESQLDDFEKLYKLLSTEGMTRAVEIKEILGRLVGSMSTEQFRFISGHLTPQQAIGFAELYRKYGPSKEESTSNVH